MLTNFKLSKKGEDQVTYFENRLKQFVLEAAKMLPHSTATEEFRNKMEEANFWGKKAIALTPSNHTSKNELLNLNHVIQENQKLRQEALPDEPEYQTQSDSDDKAKTKSKRSFL